MNQYQDKAGSFTELSTQYDSFSDIKSLSKHANLFEMQLSEDFQELSPLKL
jgi:hypothetical protein